MARRKKPPDWKALADTVDRIRDNVSDLDAVLDGRLTIESVDPKTRAFNLDTRVEELIEAWPALSDEQLDRIAGMLRSGRAS